MSVLAVVLIHVTSTFPEPVIPHWLTVVRLFVNSVSRFAVPGFIILSGFHLALNSRNERSWSFYRRTLPLIVVPYLVYSTGYVMFAHRQVLGFPWAWTWAVVTGSAFYHLWFIPVIMELYLLHPFLRRCYRRVPATAFLSVALVLQFTWAFSMGDLAERAAEQGEWTAPFAAALSFVSYIGYFLVGYWLSDRGDAVIPIILRRRFVVAATILWLVCSSAMTLQRSLLVLTGSPFLPAVPHQTIAPLLSIAALTVLFAWASAKRGSATWRCVSTIGLYAYGVYYVHPLVLQILAWFWRHQVARSTTFGLYYVLAFLLVTAVTVASVKGLARLPFGRYLA